jgi:hypothetical protein
MRTKGFGRPGADSIISALIVGIGFTFVVPVSRFVLTIFGLSQCRHTIRMPPLSTFR